MIKKNKVFKMFLLFVMSIFILCACGVDEIDTTESIENNTEVYEEIKIEQTGWVANLKVAQETNQILTVVAKDNTAVASLYEKDKEGIWNEILSTQAKIGRNGIGKTKEGDGKTPSGKYHFTFAFGIKENPGTSFEYVKVDDSFYWVDDSDSKFYNQFVSMNSVEKDWDSAEHILSAEESYHYVLATDYNIECEPGKGSAIFMHCTPTGGAGCIAIPEEYMIAILQRIDEDCILIIDDESNISTY